MRRDVVGYEGHYVIDGLKIFSLKFGKERELKPSKNKDGYLLVTLYKDGKQKTHQVHRLIAEAFIPNPENKPQVNHKNGIKTDNTIENLEWVTASENNKHAYEKKLRSATGEKNGRSKLLESDIIKIFELREVGWTQQKIADEIPTSRWSVCDILRGRRWSHVEIKKPL